MKPSNSDHADFKRSLSGSMLRMRAKTPFFAALALFAQIRLSELIETAATDGRDIWINHEYWKSLTSSQADGLLLHEVLHAALLHLPRRGVREPLLWNYACDIVVNGIVSNESPFKLPPDTIREPTLEKLSVEEVYEILHTQARKLPKLCICDLLGTPGNVLGSSDLDGISNERRRVLASYWRQAREQATLIAQGATQGNIPKSWERELAALDDEKLPWRQYLWRFLVRTPTDFQEFDRRFISQGLYIEGLLGESVRVHVCVDTSGSIDNELMRMLISEVGGILRSYPHINCDLFYADAALHGPYSLQKVNEIKKPIGGGGTDFRPFFKWLEKEGDPSALTIYLTDGFGIFPEQTPQHDVLWVVTPGGLHLNSFPFGEAVRLIR